MRIPAFAILLLLTLAASAPAWDYEPHRAVNQLALETLPDDFPPFVREPDAAERIAFLAGEPDRWRNTPELLFKHSVNPDHFMDFEDLALFGLTPETVSEFRYEFMKQLVEARTKDPSKFPAIDEEKDKDRTKSLIGFLPWAMAEQFGKLKSGFSYLRALEEGGTPQEIRNAQHNIVYVMGVMGHYAGDASQPLHTTKHFNGWVGENPHGYTTKRSFHQWIDGGFIAKAGISGKELAGSLRPARRLRPAADKTGSIFPHIMEFILQQHRLVEPLYRLEKERKFSGEPDAGDEGRRFIEGQLVAAAQMLGDIWLTAWKEAPKDSFLTKRLEERAAAAAAAAEPPLAD